MPSRGWLKFRRPTIEPVIFLYAYGLFMHLPVIQQYIYKRVSDAKGFPYSTSSKGGCNKRKLNSTLEELEKEVQSLSSYIHLGIVMFATIPSIFTALFIGAWTDIVGRRPALALPAIGSTLEALIVLGTMYFHWPLYLLFVGSAINGICGFFTTMVLAVMAYIADTTDESDRSFRLAVMEFLVFFGGMISQLTSGLWIKNLGFVAPYWFIFSCLLASVLYIILFVPESRASTENKSIRKLFSLSNIKRVWHVYKNPRDGARRNLIIFTSCTGLIVLTTLGVGGVIVLFLLHSPLCFSAEKVGYFSAFRHFSHGLGAVLGIKLLGRCLNEVNIARVGIFSLASSLVVFGFSKVDWLVFMSPVAGIFVGTIVPLFRGMMSRTVGADEQGALFSVAASLDTLCHFIGAFIFNSMYPASLKFHFSGFVFFLGATMLIIPLLLMCCLRNPGSFMSKRDLVRSGPQDNMEDKLINSAAGVASDSSTSPLQSPTSDKSYQAVA
ncbi:hypothetical protein ACROYT_G004441 [Oculina patagonica]